MHILRFLRRNPAALFAAFASVTSQGLHAETVAEPDPICSARNTVVAQVVALEQVYVYNRFGAFNPGGMLYALRRDVVVAGDDGAAVAGLEEGRRSR